MTLLEFITTRPRSYAECIAFARSKNVTWERLDRWLDKLVADGTIIRTETDNGSQFEVRK